MCEVATRPSCIGGRVDAEGCFLAKPSKCIAAEAGRSAPPCLRGYSSPADQPLSAVDGAVLSPTGTEASDERDAPHLEPPEDATMLRKSLPADATMVHARLANFAARRRRSVQLSVHTSGEVADTPGPEPLTPPCSREALLAEPKASSPMNATCGVLASAGLLDLTSAKSPTRKRPATGQYSCRGSLSALEDGNAADGRGAGHPCCWDSEESRPAGDKEKVDDSDEEASRLKRIEGQLEVMNAAAADLNEAHLALKSSAKMRLSMIQIWAVGSARLARALGANRLAKAAPYYDMLRRHFAARARVEHVSRRFREASCGDVAAETLEQLATEHAASVSEFNATQGKLRKMLKGARTPSSSITTVAPYFEAKNKHHAQLQEANDTIRQLEDRVERAKMRYHEALKQLEAMSEQVHRARAEGSDDIVSTCSSPAFSSILRDPKRCFGEDEGVRVQTEGVQVPSCRSRSSSPRSCSELGEQPRHFPAAGGEEPIRDTATLSQAFTAPAFERGDEPR